MFFTCEITHTALARTQVTDSIKTDVPRPQTSAFPPGLTETTKVKIALVRRMSPPIF